MSESAGLIRIEKIVEGGAGLSRTPLGVVLTHGTLPGELVEADVSEMKGGVRTGVIARIVEPSPERISPSCPLFLKCGGCDFLHTHYANEIALKQAILAETLERIGKVRAPLLPPVAASSAENYRFGVQLKIDEAGRIGLYRRESHDVIAFEGPGFSGCRIQRDGLNEAVARLQGRLAGFQVIKMRMGDEGFVINITSSDGHPLNADQMGLLKSIGATGIMVNDRLIFGDGKTLYIYGEADGRTYRFGMSPDTFVQSDSLVVQKVVNIATDFISAARGANRLMDMMLDLYAGAGVFGIMMARRVKEVIAVEIGEGAAADMEWNIRENRVKNVLAQRNTAHGFLRRFRGKAGVVMVDPPRGGLESGVRKELKRVGAPIIFYVSCQPSTLARDIGDLVSDGYEIESVQIFDQFGRTQHIESFTILRKKAWSEAGRT